MVQNKTCSSPAASTALRCRRCSCVVADTRGCSGESQGQHTGEATSSAHGAVFSRIATIVCNCSTVVDSTTALVGASRHTTALGQLKLMQVPQLVVGTAMGSRVHSRRCVRGCLATAAPAGLGSELPTS